MLSWIIAAATMVWGFLALTGGPQAPDGLFLDRARRLHDGRSDSAAFAAIRTRSYVLRVGEHLFLSGRLMAS